MLTGAMTQLLRTFEDWSRRCYRGALGSCKAIGLANLACAGEQFPRTQLPKSIPRSF